MQSYCNINVTSNKKSTTYLFQPCINFPVSFDLAASLSCCLLTNTDLTASFYNTNDVMGWSLHMVISAYTKRISGSNENMNFKFRTLCLNNLEEQ